MIELELGIGNWELFSVPCSFESSTSTVPPVGVNLIALDSKFQITCCKRSASPETNNFGFWLVPRQEPGNADFGACVAKIYGNG